MKKKKIKVLESDCHAKMFDRNKMDNCRLEIKMENKDLTIYQNTDSDKFDGPELLISDNPSGKVLGLKYIGSLN